MQGFIEVVRSYPYLWQTDNKKYKNVELRECTWNRIAKQCDFKDGMFYHGKLNKIKSIYIFSK